MDTNTLLKSIADYTSDVICIKDLTGKYLFLNHAAETLIGQKSSDVIGLDDTTIFPPMVATSIRVQDKKILDGKTVQTYEETVPNASGEKTVLLSTKGLLYDASGVCIGLFSISRDITQRKEIENDLNKSEKRWHSLFDILPIGVTLLNAQHKVIDLNQAICEKLKITREGLLTGEYTSRRYLRSDGSDMPAEEFPSFKAVSEKKQIKHVEIGVVTETGETIWTDVSASPLLDEGGCVIATVDITAYKKLEKNLLDKIDELSKVNEMMVNRELKMIELKNEIAALKKQKKM